MPADLASPTRGIGHSLYCFATDVVDEGAEVLLENAVKRAGIDSLTLAAKYHAVRDVYPHNPVRRVAQVAPGVFWRPDASRYAGERLQARPSSDAAGRDVLADLCTAAAGRGVDVSAWIVLLHHDGNLADLVGVQQNCFADPMPGQLCPSNPDVVRFAELLIEEVATYPVETIRLESAHFHGFGHGHHHERLPEPLGALGEFLLGLCFCPSCTDDAGAHGIDAASFADRCRRRLDQHFTGEDQPTGLDPAALEEVLGPVARPFLTWRCGVVEALVARLVRIARAADKRVTFIEQSVASQAYASGSRSRPLQDDQWVFGVSPSELISTGASLELTGYLSAPDGLASTLAEYRGVLGPYGELSLLLRTGSPDCDGAANLRQKLLVARRAGCSEVNFYNYGNYPLSSLDRVREALA